VVSLSSANGWTKAVSTTMAGHPELSVKLGHENTVGRA
jgi:hypothetical protein